MAYYVGKKLHIRPYEILSKWGVCELIVAYGTYANEDQRKAYDSINEYNKTAKGKNRIPRISEYAVRFYTNDEIREVEDGDR